MTTTIKASSCTRCAGFGCEPGTLEQYQPPPCTACQSDRYDRYRFTIPELADEYASEALFAHTAIPGYEECGNLRAAENARLRRDACLDMYKTLTGRTLALPDQK